MRVECDCVAETRFSPQTLQLFAPGAGFQLRNLPIKAANQRSTIYAYGIKMTELAGRLRWLRNELQYFSVAMPWIVPHALPQAGHLPHFAQIRYGYVEP